MMFKELRIRILEVAKAFWTKGNDLALGIDTMPHRFRVTKLQFETLRSEHGCEASSRFEDGSGYESPDYANLRRIISLIDPRPEDVVYDLGCGKGRVVCLFSRQNVRNCIGIELFPSLCRIATDNALNVRGRKSPISIRQRDVLEDQLDGGTIYFMFNPFGRHTMEQVIDKIQESWIAQPRLVRIIYYKDLHADLLETSGWLEKYHEFKTVSSINVSFWQSSPQEPDVDSVATHTCSRHVVIR